MTVLFIYRRSIQFSCHLRSCYSRCCKPIL